MEENLVSDIISILDNDELIVDNNKEINLSIEYPYLIFSRDDLVRAINLCNKLVLSKSDIPEYNSISFVPVKFTKKINLYATNELSHFRISSELLGDLNNIIEEPFCISLTILQKIVKLMGNKVLIYKNDTRYYVRLLDGDLLIDARPINLDIITIPGNPTDKLSELWLNSFGRICTSLLSLMSSEISNDHKRLYFTGNKCYFKSPFYYIESDINSSEMVLSYRDIEFISKLYKYYKSNQIILFNVDTSLSRLRLILDNIEYQFINPKVPELNLVPQEMEKLIKDSEISLNFEKLYKIVSLSTSLPDSTDKISLKYLNNELVLSILNNKGNSNFNFQFEKINKGRLYGKELILNASTLKRLLDSFIGTEKIELSLDDKGITIRNELIKAFLMNYEI